MDWLDQKYHISIRMPAVWLMVPDTQQLEHNTLTLTYLYFQGHQEPLIDFTNNETILL